MLVCGWITQQGVCVHNNLIDNEVAEVFTVERVGQLWKEILPILTGMSDSMTSTYR